MNIRKSLQTSSKALFCGVAFAIFSACAGNAPVPCAEPQNLQNHHSEESVVTEKTAPAEDTVEKKDPIVENEKNQDASTVTEQASSSSNLEQVNQPNSSETVLSSSSQTLPPDPYTAFPALADSVFAYASSLYSDGLVDSATAYLQRFRIIKPLWNNWENRADSLLNEFGKSQAEKAKQYEPMVLQIINMNQVQSAYSIVAETADSLIALAPGDSLTRFAREQKKLAYSNTLTKAKKEQESILRLAQEQAQFAEAEKQALVLQMRYRDFEDTLHIQAMIDAIHNQAQAIDSATAKYWEANDADKAMAEAEAYLSKELFDKAKDLLNKLKASKLRKEAMDKYIVLADAYCNVQRKQTSAAFGKAQKQKDSAKKKLLLKEAISYLDKCLAEYPESSQKKKVEENRAFLEKELTR